jgi:hypothetical protein
MMVYQLGALSLFLSWLSLSDNELIKSSLKGIQTLLMFGNYTKQMNNYKTNFVKEEIILNNDQMMLLKHQYSPVKEIYEICGEILDNYFDEEEDV